jgi:HSP20 family protein
MNALAHWNQFKELEELRNNLGTLFGRPHAQRIEGQEEPMRVADWTPLVDISEDAQEYLIKAELPEVKREDVKITMEDGTLTIAGDRKYEKENNGKKYHRVERAFGSFGRSFSLPDDASPAKVTADFKDGVLKVHLAKNEKARPQQVELTVS